MILVVYVTLEILPYKLVFINAFDFTMSFMQWKCLCSISITDVNAAHGKSLMIAGTDRTSEVSDEAEQT